METTGLRMFGVLLVLFAALWAAPEPVATTGAPHSIERAVLHFATAELRVAHTDRLARPDRSGLPPPVTALVGKSALPPSTGASVTLAHLAFVTTAASLQFAPRPWHARAPPFTI